MADSFVEWITETCEPLLNFVENHWIATRIVLTLFLVALLVAGAIYAVYTNVGLRQWEKPGESYEKSNTPINIACAHTITNDTYNRYVEQLNACRITNNTNATV